MIVWRQVPSGAPYPVPYAASARIKLRRGLLPHEQIQRHLKELLKDFLVY